MKLSLSKENLKKLTLSTLKFGTGIFYPETVSFIIFLKQTEELGEASLDLSTLYQGENERWLDLKVGSIHLKFNCVNFGKERVNNDSNLNLTISSFVGLSTIQNNKDVLITGPLVCSFTVDGQMYKTNDSKDGVWDQVFKISSLQQKEKTFITFNLSDSKTGSLIGNSQLYLNSLVLKSGVEVQLSNPLSNVSSGYFNLKVSTNFDIAPLSTLDGKIPKKVQALVIGGGFAGSNAARQLFDRKVDVILIEAKDAFGGRCKSLKLGMTDPNNKSAYYFDGGCNYVFILTN
jgi:hypothetical protein